MPNTTKRSRKGFTLIELLIVMLVLVIVISMAIPRIADSKRAANEASALESMRALVAAEENYRVKQTPPTYGLLSQLRDSQTLHPSLGHGFKSGYTFLAMAVPGKSVYAFAGIPMADAGDMYYYVDQSGVIRAKKGSVANAASPPVQ